MFSIYFLSLFSFVFGVIDVQSLRDFRITHKDAKLDDLKSLSPPLSKADSQFDVDNAHFNECLDLTSNEHKILSEHGVMISARQSWPSFFEAYLDLFKNDQPVYITASAILHSVHKSYVAIVSAIETEKLTSLLKAALTKMDAARTSLVGTDEAVSQQLAVYLNVARLLLADNKDKPLAVSAQVQSIVDSCMEAKGLDNLKLFGRDRPFDFSQFKPRGHYTSTPALKRYFRAMMWLGRTVVALDQGDLELKGAFALASLAADTEELGAFESVLQTLVGESDNAKAAELLAVASGAGAKDFASLATPSVLDAFRAALKEKNVGAQSILSELIVSEDDKITKPLAYKLIGQRYTIDSDVLGMVVWQGSKSDPMPWKMMPDSTDILYATLGNNDALQVPPLNNIDELPLAGGRVATARRLADAYFANPDGVSNSTLYTTWLGAQRQLSFRAESSKNKLAQSLGFQLHMMATQLTSYTHLRHANVLYVKESYTGIPGCHFPSAFVEPVPGVFAMLQRYAELGSTLLAPQLDDYQQSRFGGYFEKLKTVSGRLEAMASKAARNEPLDGDDMKFVNNMVMETTEDVVCAQITVRSGWFKELYINDDESEIDQVTVGIHTQPADEQGNIVGKVKHLGTGLVHPVVIVADGCTEAAGPAVHVGVTQLPHELTTTKFERLTDEQWVESGLATSSTPEWLAPILSGAMATGDEQLYKGKCEQAAQANPENPVSGTSAVGISVAMMMLMIVVML